MNLLKCPKCGEMFSDSYKECPFCEEDEAYLSGNKRRHNHGRRVEKPKSPSILGPALILVVVLLAGFLVYTFLGDRIAALFDGTEKPPVVDPVDPNTDTDPGTVLTIDKTELKLTVGDTAVLTVSGAENGQWSSSDSAVASVDETGKVSAVAAGTATIVRRRRLCRLCGNGGKEGGAEEGSGAGNDFRIAEQERQRELGVYRVGG